ncbi:hypothetical protein BG011_009965 [Mortierella polycephala]|uniref:Endothelin-converting enzyme 1 n=1 Tax=Mortierella polycephala TaxID=41804 RepID=A0A9P6PNC2_9FUNG|nr:hypothetical protein BG011_009965 [Mortierella polycephala]
MSPSSSTSDTTPLLGGQPNRRTSIPNSSSNNNQHIDSGPGLNTPPPLANTTNGINPNNSNQRHWSDETEDIVGPDPSVYGHQNTGAGYRRRGPPPPLHHSASSDLDAERFSGQDRPTGLRRVLYSCCCFPCRRAYFNFQNKYTKTEKYSMGIAAVALFLAIGFFCAYVRAREALPKTGKNGICTSRECTIVAADILRDMKPEVDPCTDFFAFTCGGFVDRVSIPDDKAEIGYFNLEAIRAILSSGTNNVQRGGKDNASRRNLIKLQSLFESCMDENKISEVGVKPLADLIQKMTKIFPESSSVLNTTASFSTLMSNVDDLRRVNTWAMENNLQRQGLKQAKYEGMGKDTARDGTNDDSAPQIAIQASRMDEQVKEQRIASPIDTFLNSKRGDPQFEATLIKPEREELALAITQLAWVGVTTMVKFDVSSDPKNPDDNAFQMGESGLGLPSRDYYDEDKIVGIYQSVIEQMFAIVLGKDSKVPGSSNAKPAPVWAEVAKNVVEFEKLLAAISTDKEDLKNSELTYNPRTLSQITEIIPAIDWALVLEKLLGNGATIPNPIIVSSPDYLQKLNALLNDTPVLTVQNYFAWRLIQKLSPDLAVELHKPLQQLKAALHGVSADLVTPRWETCVDVVDRSLGAMVGHYFIEKAFKGDSKELADSIVTSLRTTFVKGLANLKWLDKETLANATEKVDLLIQKIGFSVESPDVRSAEGLEDYYKDMGIDKADFFGNQIRSGTWTIRQTINNLGKPVDKAKWFMNPQTVNAYYNPSVNEIVFPAGILQQPFFHGDSPEYLNYGAIGVAAGHELTWWSNSTLEEFKTRSQCFVDQYGNFTVKDPQGRENHVNGKLTLGENLADNGGLKRAFEAWHARFKSDPHGNRFQNHLLSGLEEFTREQLFYVSFARIWCSQRRSASAIERLRTDVHSPPKWRVNGAVQNSKHFAEVFECQPRAPMHPDSKCDLW